MVEEKGAGCKGFEDRCTGVGALAFWTALGVPGAAMYSALALLLGASIAVAAGIALALLAPMPIVGAVCISSGIASDAEELG